MAVFKRIPEWFFEKVPDFLELFCLAGQHSLALLCPFFYFQLGYPQGPGDIYCCFGNSFFVTRVFFKTRLDTAGYGLHPAAFLVAEFGAGMDAVRIHAMS